MVYCLQSKGRPLDELYKQAKEAGLEREIIDAKDDEGDKPLHIACEFGNSEVVEWILSRQEELKVNVNEVDSNASSPLFLACLKGYVGAEGVGSKTEGVKVKRLEIVKMLVEKGADLNYQREVVGLTPLHWAAYNDDADLCRYLLSKGARQIESSAASMPVDIAGFTGNKGVIKVFMEHAASKIEEKMGTHGPGAGDINLEASVKKVVFDELEYLNKLSKSDKTG